MDTEVIRTFLEIVAQRNFGAAAEKLHVAQTTVSARIKLLEERLGRSLFVRNKAGATLTPAGEQFLRYAPSVVQSWERARHQVALPPDKQAVLAIGGELSLWNPLLLEWLIWMRRVVPEIAVRARVGVADDLNTQVAEGVLDVAVLYSPRHRPGLEVEQLFEETLVLVTTDPDPESPIGPEYVYVDWGTDFALHHGMSFPELSEPGLFVGLGPLALNYVLKVGGSGYFRTRVVQPHLDTGELHVVPGAPRFPYPAYAVYGTNADPGLIRRTLQGLRQVAGEAAE
ncbi:MAG: LysR family transcriptional regulator [Lautropia sp.]